MLRWHQIEKLNYYKYAIKKVFFLVPVNGFSIWRIEVLYFISFEKMLLTKKNINFFTSAMFLNIFSHTFTRLHKTHCITYYLKIFLNIVSKIKLNFKLNHCKFIPYNLFEILCLLFLYNNDPHLDTFYISIKNWFIENIRITFIFLDIFS